MQSREAVINSGSSVRIKVVESGGPKLKSILVNPNPYPKKDCRMMLCPFCKSTSVSQPKDDNKIPLGLVIKLIARSAKRKAYQQLTLENLEDLLSIEGLSM